MKKSLMMMAVVGFVCLFAAVIYAGTAVDDVVKMENKIYDKHKKGIVEFTHKKHNEDYKIGCGDCHHDAEGKALNELKMGDEVQGCAECHKKPGELKGKDAKGKSDKEKREYHANALHDNCIGCHKDFNKKNNTKKAPQTCAKCHPKKK